MTAGRHIDEAIDGAVARVREAAESELRAVVSRLQEEAAAAQEAARVTESEAVAIGREAARDAVARLLDAVQRLDAQFTLTGVLDALADLAAAGAGRAALFAKAGGEMRGWRFVGFGPEVGDARQHVVNGADRGLLGRAIAERRTQVLAARGDDGDGDGGGDPDASDAGKPPAFAALPASRGAVAVPVLVGGEPLVAIYADDVPPAGGGEAADASSHPHWTGVVELLARHAGCRLEALTANRAAEMAGRIRDAAV